MRAGSNMGPGGQGCCVRSGSNMGLREKTQTPFAGFAARHCGSLRPIHKVYIGTVKALPGQLVLAERLPVVNRDRYTASHHCIFHWLRSTLSHEITVQQHGEIGVSRPWERRVPSPAPG